LFRDLKNSEGMLKLVQHDIHGLGKKCQKILKIHLIGSGYLRRKKRF